MSKALQKSIRTWIQLVQSIKSDRTTTPIDKILIEQEELADSTLSGSVIPVALKTTWNFPGLPGKRQSWEKSRTGNVELHKICHSHVIRITPAGKNPTDH